MLKKIALIIFLPLIANFGQNGTASRSLTGVQKFLVSKSDLYLEINGEFPTTLQIYNARSGGMIEMPKSLVWTEADFTATAVYGYSNKINFFSTVPLRFVNHYSPDLIQANKGFGDIELGGYYGFMKTKVDGFSLNGILSVVLPIGYNKNLDATELPLGDGAFMFRGGVTGNLIMDYGTIIYSAEYLLKLKNSAGVNLGDIISGSVSLENGFKVNGSSFTWETGVILSEKLNDSNNGINLANSSFFNGNLFAGIKYSYSDNIDFGLVIPYSVIKRDGWFTDYSINLQMNYLLESL